MRRGPAALALLLLLAALPVVMGPLAPAEAAAAPSLAMVVEANGAPAGQAPGPSVEAGTAIAWTYDVTNTGPGNLWALYIWHDDLGRARCSDRSLAPGETVRCTASGTAVAQAYSRTVRAWAWDDAGAEAATAVEAHYAGWTSFVPAPAIDLEALVAGSDADAPPGPMLAPRSAVELRYEIRNTGNVDLWGLWLRDARFGTVRCPTRHLPPGGSTTCVSTRTAAAGFQQWSAEAWGWDSYGGSAADYDALHYVGVPPAPSVDIEALVDGYDGDTPWGPRVVRQPGESIPFTYVVTNTGGLPLTAVQVTDDVLGPVACPADALGIWETMTCRASRPAVIGQFASTGRVTATAETVPVSDSDPIYYHVRTEARVHHLTLEVTVNGSDADDAGSGPLIPVGEPVLFTYVISYTGNSAVFSVTIRDPFIPEAQITCDGGRTLADGRTLTCTATVPAAVGPYASLVTVVSWDPEGRRVTAEDWAYYHGMA